ncbi:MAG: hypothetical protein Tsb009_36330 [Planctomycetaceae bacterium]
MTSSHTQTPQQIPSNPSGSGAWDVLSAMLPTADWTAESQTGQLTPLIHDRAFVFPHSSSPEVGEEGQSSTQSGNGETDLYDRMARIERNDEHPSDHPNADGDSVRVQFLSRGCSQAEISTSASS